MKRFIKTILFVVPFFLGVAGFLQSGMPIGDSAFNSMILYVLGYADPAPNWLVEIARWAAPLATASGIFMILSRYALRFRNSIRNAFRDTVAVYGDNDSAQYIRGLFGNRLVVPLNGYVKADRYVLYDNDESNLEFYAKYRNKLKNSPVCLKCSSVSAQDLVGDRIIAFNPEKTAARLFWKENSFYKIAKENGFKLSFALIGFDKLGQELLLQGLQINIFSPSQKIEYHVFGETSEFANIHTGIKSIGDEVIYHEDWTAENGIMNNSIIIVSARDDPFAVIHKLMLASSNRNIYVLTSANNVFDLFEGKEDLHIFEVTRRLLTEELLFSEILLKRAKTINLRYAHIYHGVEETESNREKEWDKLNSFSKCSNISSADYHDIRLDILKDWGITDAESLTDEQMDLLAEMEHIRWSRYHYLLNWSYGIPEDGKAKDSKKHLHRDLVPYDQLSENTKDKDRENIRVLLAIE